MKIVYIALGLTLSMVSLNAQNKHTANADQLFSRLEYVDAAAQYQKQVDNGHGDPYVYKQLGDSYYNIFDSKNAISWYAKATESGADAETYFRYAQMLKVEGKYEQANAQMKKFASLSPSDERAITFKQDPDYLPKLRSQTRLFDEQILSINSEVSDFGGMLTNDDHLYFASARNKSRKTYGWNEEPYLDMYVSVRNPDGTFAEPTPVNALNTKWHEGYPSVTSDGNTIYFSSESFLEKEFEKDRKNRLKHGQVYLYKATKNGEEWTDVKELSINSKDFSNSNPSISKDGSTLYFSSNRPGGLGGFDIFMASVNADGTLGTPENLGKKVNTEGNEGFAFITDGNRLYFASDARKGFGGLDVFLVDLDKNSEAQNIGAPVNTAKDDFAFTFNTTKNIGFFSSNRDGNDNIYQVNPICTTVVLTLVKDANTGAILSGAKVSILDPKNNVIESKTSDISGQVSYTVDCGKTFTIQASKDGYEAGSFPVAITTGKQVDVTANLKPIESIVTPDAVVLNDIFFEYNKSNITKEGAFELDKLVQVLNKYPQMVIMVKSHTDNRGSDNYNLALSDRRARSTVQYILSKAIETSRISGKGYGESEPKVACTDCSDEQHTQNRRSEFLIVKK